MHRRWMAAGFAVAVAAVVVVVIAGTRTAAVQPAISLPSGDRSLASEMPKLDVPAAIQVVARVTVDGKPAAGVSVAITDGTMPVLARALTEHDGSVAFDELPRGPFELWAAAPGMASAPMRIEQGGTVDLALAPAANVRGSVVTAGEVPPGSTVTLVPLDGDHAARIATVEDGKFRIDGVPHGRWRVESAVAGHVTADQVVRIGDAEVPLDLHLARTGTASGVVVDARGAPIPNATIVLRDQAGVQRPLTIASTGLRWIHPLAGTRQMPVNESARFSAPRPGARPTECGRGHCGMDIGSVRGAIVHAAADGEIASIFAESRTEAGKVVAIHHGGGLKTFYMHLDEIRPGLEVGQPIKAGDPVGTLGSTGFTRAIPHVHFAITHEYGRTWYLDPEPVLRHAVVLPAPRAYEPFEPGPKEPLIAKPVIHRITTDATGAFHLPDVAPGSYVVGAFASDFAPGASAPFVVTGGADTQDLKITLEPGIAVRGVVLGRDGPLAGAVVMAGAGIGESAHKIATTFTDKTGRFTLRALAGKVTLAVQAPMYGTTERALVVDDRTREQTFQLVIENAHLRGQILAPDGGAAPDVSVRVVEGLSQKRTLTDAQGRFALTVAAGSYTVELSSAEFPTKRVTIEPEQWREIRLEPGGGARILVRDAQALTPLANVRLELAGPQQKGLTRTTDAKGLMTVNGLVAGEWRVTARAPGFTTSSKTARIQVRLVDEVVLDLARGASIAGTIRDRYGRRVAGAKVSIGELSTKTDGQGEFKIVGAPTGAGVIEAELEGARGVLPIELAPGAERVALTIELQ